MDNFHHALRSPHYQLKSQEAKLREGISQDSVVVLVDQIIHKAIQIHASDIHLEPTPHKLRVRYRIDGILYDQEPVPFEQRFLVISRLKVLTSLDIAERRVPQDGKLMICFVPDVSDHERDIDLRVSTFPTIYGEKMVVRILDRAWHYISFELLGCNKRVQDSITHLIDRPHGFFLVTGPTGSGKTTTLYAILSKLNNAERNIVTMEDPVEYHIDGITQSQINEKANFTFERGLRSLLRQDPDVAMVGEIRDKQTAQIAIEAALTGHLVLSTLHTNDSVSAVTRLIDMGIEPFLITASLTGVLAQRLVRVLCEHCKKEVPLNECEKVLAARHAWDFVKTYKAQGCQKCLYLGYKGRTSLFECFVLTHEVRELIMHGASTQVLQDCARKGGMVLLYEDGLEKVQQGIIAFEEFLRVVAFE